MKLNVFLLLTALVPFSLASEKAESKKTLDGHLPESNDENVASFFRAAGVGHHNAVAAGKPFEEDFDQSNKQSNQAVPPPSILFNSQLLGSLKPHQSVPQVSLLERNKNLVEYCP